jgi:hypothetical protein
MLRLTKYIESTMSASMPENTLQVEYCAVLRNKQVPRKFKVVHSRVCISNFACRGRPEYATLWAGD